MFNVNNNYYIRSYQRDTITHQYNNIIYDFILTTIPTYLNTFPKSLQAFQTQVTSQWTVP